jgi:uncharacterized protein YvpB
LMKRLTYILTITAMLFIAGFSPAMGKDFPSSYYVPGVIGHAQGYALSCESRSAADLAAFWGVNLGESDFLQALPKSDNPDQGFVGNPNERWGQLPPHGYGVHAGPVAETLRTFGVQAEAHTELSWDDLRGEISSGRPVIVWIIGAMWQGTAVDYITEDGSKVRAAAFEHTMLLTGYSENSIEVIDAYSGNYQYYWLDTFLESWSVLGNMAVFASGSDQQQAHKTLAEGSTYTVKSGDYLMELARKFGTTWLELAQVNSIAYPYTIYAGQVLRMPAGNQAGVVTTEPRVEDEIPVPGDDYQVHLPFVTSKFASVSDSSSTTTATATETPKTVIVLHTDTLIGFGRSIGVAWHVLAELNHLPPTYVLHPGEILKVK